MKPQTLFSLSIWTFLRVVDVVTQERTPWHPTILLESWLPSPQLISSTSCLSLFYAARRCELNSRCTLFCRESDHTFSFWNIISEPYLDHSSQGSVKSCWTSRPRGSFVPFLDGISIRGTEAHPNHPASKVNMLLNGLHTYQHHHALFTKYSTKSFFVVDLARILMIKTVILYPFYTPSMPTRFQDISVRLGKTVTENGDFSTYDEICFIPGPVQDHYSPYIINVNGSHLARYVSVQTMLTVWNSMHIGHVEIYTETEEEYRRSLQKYAW